MKNINLIINIILVAAVIFLFIDRQKSNAKQQVKSVSNSSPVAGIVYVNSDTIWANYSMVKEYQEELVAEKLKLDGEYEKVLKGFEEDYSRFQSKAHLYSERQAQIEQQNLISKEQEILKYRQELEQKFAMKEMEMNGKIQESIMSSIQDFNNQNPSQLVLNYNGGSDVLLADSTMDITTEVLTLLEKNYTPKNATTVD